MDIWSFVAVIRIRCEFSLTPCDTMWVEFVSKRGPACLPLHLTFLLLNCPRLSAPARSELSTEASLWRRDKGPVFEHREGLSPQQRSKHISLSATRQTTSISMTSWNGPVANPLVIINQLLKNATVVFC